MPRRHEAVARAPRALAAAALALAAIAGGGCTARQAKPVNVIEARIDREHRPTHMGLALKSGQIVLSEAPGPYSVFFSLVPEQFHEFTHAGVLVVEDGEPFVYDVTGEYSPGIDDRPTDGIVGGIRRLPFVEYCRPNLYCEVYDPPAGASAEKIAAFALARFKTGVDFDAYFKYDEHEKLFCTEFVALALQAGGAKLAELVPSSKNPSMILTMDYLAVPPGTCLPAGVFGDPARCIGAVGQFGTKTAARSYFQAKRELHRRFDPSQKLGNLFINDMGDILLREEIIQFLVAAVHLFDQSRTAPSEAAVAMAVRELADDTFGPMAPTAPAAKSKPGEKHT